MDVELNVVVGRVAEQLLWFRLEGGRPYQFLSPSWRPSKVKRKLLLRGRFSLPVAWGVTLQAERRTRLQEGCCEGYASSGTSNVRNACFACIIRIVVTQSVSKALMVEGRAQPLVKALRLLPPSPGPPSGCQHSPGLGIRCPHPSAAGEKTVPSLFPFPPSGQGWRESQSGKGSPVSCRYQQHGES